MDSPRLTDLQRFYALLNELITRQGGVRLLQDCHGRLEWPDRGVYFFFEPGEVRATTGTGLRVVRVGTHGLKAGSQTTLWNRLSQHRGSASTGSGNHRGSIFRLLVGAALMEQRPDWRVRSWGEGSSAPESVRLPERPLEGEVSARIGAMPFTWLPILDQSGPSSLRGIIERGSIALLSNWRREALDSWTDRWLGLHCPRERVRGSGLWNQNHVDESYDASFLDVFERLVEGGGREPRALHVVEAATPPPLAHARLVPRPIGGNAALIVSLLQETPDLDDDEISARLGITPRQQVNQICRRLERNGVLRRTRGARGKIVNRLVDPVEGAPPSMVVPSDPPPQVTRQPDPQPVPIAVDTDDLSSTLLLIPCSGRKKKVVGREESGPSILHHLSEGLASELASARAAVRTRASVDESTMIPAWERYDGTLYQSGRPALRAAIEADVPIAILSGGYGVVLATEPIGDYEAVFKSSWWPRGLLERVLAEYAGSVGVRSVRAFLSSSTGYSSVVRRVRWGRGVREATLHCPHVSGGGAMVKAPRAQGEALAAMLSGQLHDGWQSSDGVALSAERLV